MAACTLMCACATSSADAGQHETIGTAVFTAAVAGLTWSTAGGCKLAGCVAGSYCDAESELCEVRSCGEGCPTHTRCNEGMGRCEDVLGQPARPPEPPELNDSGGIDPIVVPGQAVPFPR